jgi:ketosteroid isomerase-like protein
MGKEALRSLVEADRLWSKAASEGDFEEFGFSWESKLIEVSNSGDMGYAYGTYTTSFDPETEHNYSTLWRRKGGGDWKVVLETDL